MRNSTSLNPLLQLRTILIAIGLLSFSFNTGAIEKDKEKDGIHTIARVVATQELVVVNESPGFIKWVAEVGTEVRKAQTLVKFDDSELKLELEIIKKEQSRLKAQLSYNKKLLLKMQELHLKKANSENDVDRLAHEVEQLSFKVEEKQLKAQQIENRIEQMHVTAPFDGTVVQRNTNAFQYEKMHEQLLRFVGKTNKELEVSVPGKYLESINSESTLSFSSRFGQFELAISSIIPEVIYNDSNFKLRAKLPDLNWVDGEIIYTEIVTN